MAIRVKEKANLKDTQPQLGIDQEYEQTTDIRIDALNFGESTLTVDFSLRDPTTGHTEAVVVVFDKETTPKKPEEDVLADDGITVLVEAGSERVEIPSYADLREMSVGGRKLGEVLDSVKAVGYGLAQAINPEWVGEEV